jgi:hypothetical protein
MSVHWFDWHWQPAEHVEPAVRRSMHAPLEQNAPELQLMGQVPEHVPKHAPDPLQV